MLTTQAGIEISISPMSLVDHAGNPITGSVQISIEEYSEYDAFHKDQITTETNNNVLLESAGMFNIEVKQAGSTLRLKDGSNYTVSFPTSDPSMKAYAGTQLPDGSVVWEEESNWLTGLDTARLRTLFSPDSFRFINCDKPIIVNDPVNHVIVLNQEDEGKDWLATLYLKERRTACRISKQTDGSISVNPNFQLPTGEKALITIMMVHNNLVYWYDTTITLGDSPSLTVPKLTPITKQEFTARAQYLKNF